MKLQTAILALILVAVLTAVVILTVRFSAIQKCVDLIGEKVEEIDVGEITDAVRAFTEAADKVAEVDTGELNEAVSSLQSAAENLSGVDVDSLNKLVSALEGVAEKLEGAVNAISSIFGKK